MPVRTRSLTPMEKWPRGLWRSFAKGEGATPPRFKSWLLRQFLPSVIRAARYKRVGRSSRLSSPDISSRAAMIAREKVPHRRPLRLRPRPGPTVRGRGQRSLYSAGSSKYGINLWELNDICLFDKRLGEISERGRPSHSVLGIVAVHRALTPVREVRFFQGGPVFAGIAQSAERNVANVEVADSASAARTTIRRPGQALGMLSRIDWRCAPRLLVVPGALHLDERERSGPCDEYETGDCFGDGHCP